MGGRQGAIFAIVDGILIAAVQALAVALLEFVAVPKAVAIGLVRVFVLRRAFDGARPATDLVIAVGHAKAIFVAMHEPVRKNGLLQQRLFGAASALRVEIA